MNLNLNNYDPITLTKFEIIGSYFIHLYYNELYFAAIKLQVNGYFTHKVESYKNILSDYIKYTKNNNMFYNNSLKGIHGYIISTTSYATMSLNECIDFLAIEFMPQHLFNDSTKKQKNDVLLIVFRNILSIFTEQVILNYLPIIINDRNIKNTRELQDLLIPIILLEKDKMYSKFINPNKANKMVPNELFNTMQKKMYELAESKQDLVKKNKNLLLIIDKLKEKIHQINDDVINLTNVNTNYTQKIQLLENNFNTFYNNSKQLEEDLQISKQQQEKDKIKIKKQQKIIDSSIKPIEPIVENIKPIVENIKSVEENIEPITIKELIENIEPITIKELIETNEINNTLSEESEEEFNLDLNFKSDNEDEFNDFIDLNKR